jgi:hypothetical protein
MTSGFDQNRAARGAHARVHYDKMNGAFGKVRPRFGNEKSGFVNIERWNVVAQVNQGRARRDTKHNAFHDGNKVIGFAKVCGEGNDGHRKGTIIAFPPPTFWISRLLRK